MTLAILAPVVLIKIQNQKQKGKKFPYEMFNPYGESKAFALDDNLASFLKEYFSKYLDDETMAKVLENCPVPDHDNLSVPKLDEYWLEIFSPDKRNIPLIKSDKSLVRVRMYPHSFTYTCRLYTCGLFIKSPAVN